VAARFRSFVGQPMLDRLVLIGVVALAAVLRLINLPARGMWDADQGHDMLVLRALIRAGEVPLLGPPTSIGDFHHGVLYYYLLAPSAALSGADPVAIAATIAIAGVAAVAVTWWLARAIGGSVAGAVAGLLMAVSASAVDESIFIWNPNLIALSSSIALAAAWRAWTTGRARWWVVAGIGAIVTMHCHVLGAILLPPIAALWVAAVRRPGGRGAVARTGLVVVALLVLSYVPLAIHELGADFSETRALLAFVAFGGEPSTMALPARLLIIGLRVLAWPLAGLVTNAPAAALLAAAFVVAVLVWRARAATGAERTAATWFAGTLAWTILALTVAASGLATAIPRLPNDHYHAFADPIVFVVAGLGAAAIARWRPKGSPTAIGPALAGVLVVVIAAFNLATQPPQTAPDGGWPAAQTAATRVIAAAGTEPIELQSLPTFKSAEALAFPLVAAGATVGPAGPDGATRVVLCDALFEGAIGAECGGPAEDAATAGNGLRLVDRFEAAPGRWVSVYH